MTKYVPLIVGVLIFFTALFGGSYLVSIVSTSWLKFPTTFMYILFIALGVVTVLYGIEKVSK